MAKIKFYKNMLEDNFDAIDVEANIKVSEYIEEYTPENPYNSDLVECYDADTGETFYAALSDDLEPSVMIRKGDEILSPDYIIHKDDIIDVIFLPTGSGGKDILDAFLGFVGGAVVGFCIGFAHGGVVGGIVGAAFGSVLGAAVPAVYKAVTQKPQITTEAGKELKTQPDVRGANNQSLANNPYPFLIGKHLINPYLAGNPYTEYSGDIGEDAYIHVLYCVGYAPLKLTDLKLGDYMMSYNRPHSTNTNTQTLMRGTLSGYSQSGQPADSGDILDIWKNNDIKVEILQHRNGETLNRGTIYPETKIDKEINAEVLFVVDKTLYDLAPVVYKGVTFPTNFKTNNVYFTESCPLKFTLNLKAPNGLFGSRSETINNVSKTAYKQIPIYYCIQWRPYSSDNPTSKADGSDYNLWHNITKFNGKELGVTYNKSHDLSNHKGNDFGNISGDLNNNFVGKTVTNFEQFSGEDGVTEMRFHADVDLRDYPGIFEQIINKKNSVKGVEVRILRVSPSYLNQQVADSAGEDASYGPYSYSDVVQVTTLTTTLFNEDKYRKDQTVEPVYAIPRDADLEKFCYVAIKAKAGLNGYVTSTLEKFSCMGEAFAPHWDTENKKWLPENIHKITSYAGYYKKDGVDEAQLSDYDYRQTIKDKRVDCRDRFYEIPITESEFLEARKDNIDWTVYKGGSNYAETIKNIVLTGNSTDNKCYLPEAGKIYNDNSCASGFMLGIVGPQNGIMARGYEGINLSSVGYWKEQTEALQDGSVDNEGNLVSVRMEANAYIFKSEKLENLLSEIAAAGRAIYTFDTEGDIKIVFDEAVDYPVGIISDQNCLSSQDSFSYEELPAGMAIQFPDENDGYENNTVYCWGDGNSEDNYKGQVIPVSFKFVTNPRQCWSLGRYLLANKILNKEVLIRKIGLEGNTYTLGDVILVQGDALLIGEGSGRVQQILEEDGTIYGFMSDNAYNFSSDVNEDGLSVMGVTIMQPKQYGRSRVVTLRMAAPNTSVTLGHETYTQKKGITNLVLFNEPLIRDFSNDGSCTATDIYKYNFIAGDTCLFGEYEKTAAPYRIIKIKQESDNTFSETLVRYNEGVYQYGARLPSFQNYTKTDPVVKDPISLSEVPSNLLGFNNTTIANNNVINEQLSKFYANRVVNLYKKSSEVLTETGITSDLYYDFSQDTIRWNDATGSNGWTYDYAVANRGEGSMYFTSATAYGQNVVETIQPTDWTPPIVFGANGANGDSGLSGLTIFLEKNSITIEALDNEGTVNEKLIIDKAHVEIDGDPVPFRIGDVAAANTDVKGFEFNQKHGNVFIKIVNGTQMESNGFIKVPIITNGVKKKEFYSDEVLDTYTDEVREKTYGTFELDNEDHEYILYVAYAKAVKGIQGVKGETGEQGPSYLGVYAVGPEEMVESLPIGSWFLSSTTGFVYQLVDEDGKIYWKNVKDIVGSDEAYYRDYRVLAAINDMMVIAQQGTEINPTLISTVNLWCQNLIANEAFIDTLSSNVAFLNNVFTNNLILSTQNGKLQSENYQENISGTILKSDGYFESQNAKIRGEIEATSGSFEGKITANSLELKLLPGNVFFIRVNENYKQKSSSISYSCNYYRSLVTCKAKARLKYKAYYPSNMNQNFKVSVRTTLTSVALEEDIIYEKTFKSSQTEYEVDLGEISIIPGDDLMVTISGENFHKPSDDFEKKSSVSLYISEPNSFCAALGMTTKDVEWWQY